MRKVKDHVSVSIMGRCLVRLERAVRGESSRSKVAYGSTVPSESIKGNREGCVAKEVTGLVLGGDAVLTRTRVEWVLASCREGVEEKGPLVEGRGKAIKQR